MIRPTPGQARARVQPGLEGCLDGLWPVLLPCSLPSPPRRSIADERERDTWAALVLTPLTGREIVRAKVLGSALEAARGRWRSWPASGSVGALVGCRSIRSASWPHSLILIVFDRILCGPGHGDRAGDARPASGQRAASSPRGDPADLLWTAPAVAAARDLEYPARRRPRCHLLLWSSPCVVQRRRRCDAARGRFPQLALLAIDTRRRGASARSVNLPGRT